MITRKVSKHPTGSKFVYLPKRWCEQQTVLGWNGDEVDISETSKLFIEPHPAKRASLIMSITPLRLPIAGGGSDLPEYYTTHKGGTWVSAAINSYIYIILKHRFEKQSKFVYSETQYVDNPSQFNHPILRAVLTKYHLIQHLELISVADLPAHLGLGSSGSFTVGLLNAVHKFLSQERTTTELAEEAYEIERLTLGRKIGKQDQYACATGGINIYRCDEAGNITITPLNVPNFQKWLLLFYVDQRQISASEALSAMTDSDRQSIADIGVKSIGALLNCDFEAYGNLMDAHWQIKSKSQPKYYSEHINLAKTHGAIGGKLVGAGMGGCILLTVPPENQLSVIEAMASAGIIQISFSFEPFGAEVY